MLVMISVRIRTSTRIVHVRYLKVVMTERFVTVSTVTGSRIRGCLACSYKARRDFSVMAGLAEKITAKWCRTYLKETEAQHTATPPSMAQTLSLDK